MRKISDLDKIGFIILDVVIIIGIIICSYEAVSTYNSHTKYLHNYYGTATYNNILEGTIAINFTSDVFSTQNPINVNTSFTFDDKFKSSHPYLINQTTINLLLFDSRPEKPEYANTGEMLRPPMNLTRNNVDGRYTGSGTIVYDSEGDKCIHVIAAIVLADTNCIPTSTNTVIHISSIDSLLQLNTNRTNLTLTWVLVAFTIVAIRSFMKDMIQNLLDFFKTKKATNKTKNTPTKQQLE